MSEGRRPGGLTALAVLNFVFGGLGALGILFLLTFLRVADEATEGEATANMPDEGIVYLSMFLGIITVGLMIASGVGYIGQKLFLGRKLGNAYAIVSFISTGVGLTVQDFGLQTIIGLVYPVLTLVLINTTFKDDLVN